MAKLVTKNVAVKVNAVELSTYVAEIDLGQEVDEVDVTGMGAVSHEIVAGLRNDEFSMTFWQDFATAKVDQTLSPLLGTGSVFLVEVWPDGTTTSATNPKYSGSCQLLAYHPIAGGVGDGGQTEVTFKPTGAGITRATA